MAEVLRIAMIGLDTSHCKAFTELLHNEKNKDHIPGGRIVAAYPSFSEDVEASRSRVEQYTTDLRDKYNVKITKSIEELLPMADAFLIESVDGRRHLKELKAIVPAGKPVFIDKPFAASLADAKEMVRILNEAKIPCFSSSSLRFEKNLQAFVADSARGKVMGCDAYSPSKLDPSNPGFFWYGIHGVEILYTVMGRGCQSVRCTSTKDSDVAVGVWNDARVGTMRGIRSGQSDYGAIAYCEKKIVPIQHEPNANYYSALLKEIMEFFRTRKPPVPMEETLEIMAFIDAAWESSQKGGESVKLKL